MATGDVPFTSVPLPEPRPLTARERGLLDVLLASPIAPAALRAQAAVAVVSEVCSCGCASITFAVPDDAPRAVFSRRWDDVRNDRDADVQAVATLADGREVDVILHAVLGVLFELEVWSGDFGDDAHAAAPDPARVVLRPPERRPPWHHLPGTRRLRWWRLRRRAVPTASR